DASPGVAAFLRSSWISGSNALVMLVMVSWMVAPTRLGSCASAVTFAMIALISSGVELASVLELLAIAAINARVAYAEVGGTARVVCAAGQTCWPELRTGPGVARAL